MITVDADRFQTAEFMPYHKGRSGRHPLSMPFVAWDGEGITPPGATQQNFVLFGSSSGHTVQAHRLSTDDCLRVIIEAEQANPNAIHVGFAFGYDVEMILSDLSIRHLKILRTKGYVIWHGYRIEYRRSKWFQISKRVNGDKVSARIWDVWGYFQSSFVAALEKNLGEVPELAGIVAGKAGRSAFTYEDLSDGSIIEYWQAELRLTVQMMDALRKRLYGADLTIRQWHGPGAIATFAYKQHKMQKHMDREVPAAVNTAAQYAYAGGRFELFKVGYHPAEVFSYDIRSAYPSAIVHLPSLSTGHWFYNPSPDPSSLARFGVYRIRFASPAIMSSKPMPFFYRDPRYAIHFPNVVEGWYWTPEARFAAFMPNDAIIVEGWEYIEDGTRPFEWVGDVYKTRAQWKRDGNPSEMALKLLLNSLYGKMAQRVGWESRNGPPIWHQLEWAGFVTSTARAKLFEAMMHAYARGSLIGVETDGIFTTAELPLDVGQELGQWEAERYESMIYLQSGFYFKQTGSKWTAKYRGFDKGSVTTDAAMQVLRDWQPWTGSKGIIEGQSTRFSTMGSYLRSKDADELRNTWTTNPRRLSIAGDGKRIHRANACAQCQQQISPADAMHMTTISEPIGGISIPHSLPWLTNGDDPNLYREREDGDNVERDH